MKPGPAPKKPSQRYVRMSITLPPELAKIAEASGNVSKFVRDLFAKKRKKA